MSVLRTQIASRNKTSLKTIPSCLGDGILKLQCNCKYIQWYLVALDFTEFKTYKPDPYKVKRRSSEFFFMLRLLTKLLK